MTKANRSWLFFGLSTATVALSTVLVGMTNHRNPVPPAEAKAVKAFTSKELAAKDVLKSELHRRFTDRQNVDFGMGRVINPGSRMHFGPTMDITPGLLLRDKTRRAADGTYESLIDGEWIASNLIKPTMTPENESERSAIGQLNESGVDVAIYTVGQFELDRGDKPVSQNLDRQERNQNYVDFYWGSNASLRAKGPAYLSQKAPTAPRAYEIVDFGRQAWASGQEDFVAEGKGDWVYFAHRIAAPDMSCAKCHGDRKVFEDRSTQPVKGAVHKPGDGVGLFVIAMRRS